jgi:hypothetical protein
VPALVVQIDSQHGPSQPSRQAQYDLNQLESNISTSAATVVRGATATVTGNGFIPGRNAERDDGARRLRRVPAATGPVRRDERPLRGPNSTVPGQAWDAVTATVGRPETPGQPVAVSGPEGNGSVTVAVDTSQLQPGRYVVTTGNLLTQSASFLVNLTDPFEAEGHALAGPYRLHEGRLTGAFHG